VVVAVAMLGQLVLLALQEQKARRGYLVFKDHRDPRVIREIQAPQGLRDQPVQFPDRVDRVAQVVQVCREIQVRAVLRGQLVQVGQVELPEPLALTG
jgi:hypothetical protein